MYKHVFAFIVGSLAICCCGQYGGDQGGQQDGEGSSVPMGNCTGYVQILTTYTVALVKTYKGFPYIQEKIQH